MFPIARRIEKLRFSHEPGQALFAYQLDGQRAKDREPVRESGEAELRAPRGQMQGATTQAMLLCIVEERQLGICSSAASPAGCVNLMYRYLPGVAALGAKYPSRLRTRKAAVAGASRATLIRRQVPSRAALEEK